MQEFWVWFQTGFFHITDLAGYDHMLFLLVLIGPYNWENRKELFWLISAFTLGHCLSLAASTLHLVKIKSYWIELLIPLTILLTALENMVLLTAHKIPNWKFKYTLSALFGLIHGLGFSYLLKALLGRTENWLLPLFAFNVGIEIGQILILCLILLVSFLLFVLFKLKERNRCFLFSGIAIILAVDMILSRI